MTVDILAHEGVVVVARMLTVDGDGRDDGKRILLDLGIVEAVVTGRPDVALHVAGAPHRHGVDLAAPARLGHVVGLDEAGIGFDLARRRVEGALAGVHGRFEGIVGLIDLGAYDRVGVEVLPGLDFLFSEGDEIPFVNPLLDGLLVDLFLLVDPVFPLDVLHAGVVALDDLVAQALGDLRPDPLLGADLAGELRTASAEGEVVAHAIGAADEALVAVHVLVHALELPYGSRQDDVAQLGGGLVHVPLEAPVELRVGHALEALVHVRVVVGVVVLEDDHLDVGQGAVIGGRADEVTELAFRDAALPVVLLTRQDLGEAVVVEEYRHLVITRIAMPVGGGGGDASRRGQARTGLAAAMDGDVAGHGLQNHGSRRAVVAHVALGAAVEVLQVHRLRRAIEARELADGLGGNRADGGGPLGGLLDAVFAFAHDVGTPLVETLLVDPLFDELVVEHVLLEEHLRDGEHHGQVGAGTDGDPLVGDELGRLGVARIDDDGLDAVFVCELHVVGRLPVPRDDRVHAPQDEELGIEDVRSLEARNRVLQASCDLGQVDAQVQHLAGRVSRGGVLSPSTKTSFPPRCQRKAVLLEARILRMEDAIGTVFGLDLLHLIGDGVQRLVPADGYEVSLARPLFPDALHGVQKTRLAVEFLLPGMSHGARARLDVAFEQFLPRLVLAAVVLVDGVIGFDCEDLAILHMAFQNAGRIPTAICRT